MSEGRNYIFKLLKLFADTVQVILFTLLLLNQWMVSMMSLKTQYRLGTVGTTDVSIAARVQPIIAVGAISQSKIDCSDTSSH